MSLAKPEPGLVIRYSHLWLREHREGREEGVKDRPYAIILAARDQDGDIKTLVVPVTHSPPESSASALELPLIVKRQLGLDGERSWVVLSESNFFTWPGPDLRRVGDQDDSSVAYGFLPPKFFAELKRRWLAFEAAHGSRRVPRTECETPIGPLTPLPLAFRFLLLPLAIRPASAFLEFFAATIYNTIDPLVSRLLDR